jgi:hypothetical protein
MLLQGCKVDGGMGARTGWMIEPYLDAEYGMPLMDMAELAMTSQKPTRPDLPSWCMPWVIAPTGNCSTFLSNCRYAMAEIW